MAKTETPAAAPATPAAASGTAPATPATPATTTPAGTTAAAPAAAAAQGTTVASSSEPAAPATPATPVAETPKAPAKYELTLPEGGRLSEIDVKSIEQLARANDWDNDQAQAMLEDFDARLVEQSDRFLTETKADKDYGGDKLEESQRLVHLVLDKVRPPDHPRTASLKRVMDRGGIGNNLEFVSLLADIGRMMDEDHPISAGPGGNAKRDAAAVLYPEKK